MRNRRLRLGLLQREVAEIVGTTKATIYHWEANRSSPQLRFVPAVNAFLGYDAYSTQEETLGERIVGWRRAHGVSQKALARMLGIDQTTLAGWERGEHKPSRRLRERLVAAAPEVDGCSAGDARGHMPVVLER